MAVCACGGELIVTPMKKRKHDALYKCAKCGRSRWMTSAEKRAQKGSLDGTSKEAAPHSATPPAPTPAGPTGGEPAKPRALFRFIEWD